MPTKKSYWKHVVHENLPQGLSFKRKLLELEVTKGHPALNYFKICPFSVSASLALEGGGRGLWELLPAAVVQRILQFITGPLQNDQPPYDTNIKLNVWFCGVCFYLCFLIFI